MSKLKSEKNKVASKETAKKINKNKEKSEMIIKWTDLMPGDILQFNPDYVVSVVSNRNLYDDEKKYFKDNVGKNLVIKKVDEDSSHNGDTIRIYFTDTAQWDFRISIDTGRIYDPVDLFYSTKPVYIVVGLAKE